MAELLPHKGPRLFMSVDLADHIRKTAAGDALHHLCDRLSDGTWELLWLLPPNLSLSPTRSRMTTDVVQAAVRLFRHYRTASASVLTQYVAYLDLIARSLERLRASHAGPVAEIFKISQLASLDGELARLDTAQLPLASAVRDRLIALGE